MINIVIFGGNLTSQPELKSFANDVKIVNFSLASNRSYKNNKGEKVEEVEFGNCVLYGKQAEIFCQYAVKGQNFTVEGRMQTKSWEDKDTGKKNYKTEIIVNQFHFGQKPKENSSYQQDNGSDVQQLNEKPNEIVTGGYIGKIESGVEYGEVINPDDIPF